MTRRRSLMSVDDSEQSDSVEEQEVTHDETAYEESSEQRSHEGFLTDPGYEDAYHPLRFGWVAPTFAVLTIIGWTGFFGWINQAAMLAGASPAQWSEWIIDWCVPVLLVVGLWLLAMRSSSREASRFNNVARALSEESSQLESRLAVVNRELSLARDFIASQSRDLESLGRVATERLSTNADRLQSLIHDNSSQLETIGGVSQTALSNMESLRDQLPVLTSAARDMSNQIGNAGNIAQTQITELVEAFDRLNQFGEVGEGHVERINEAVTNTLEAFDRQVASIGEVTQARFRRLRDVSEAFRSDLVESEDAAFASLQKRSEELTLQLTAQASAQQEMEAEALSAMRRRIAAVTDEGQRLLSTMGDGREQVANAWSEAIAALEERMAEAIGEITRVDETAMENARNRLAALSEEAGNIDARTSASIAAFDADMSRRRDELEEQQRAETDALEARLHDLDRRISERQEEHLAHVSGLAERGEALAARLNELDLHLATLTAQGEETGGALGEATQLLSDRLQNSRAALDESSSFVAKVTDDSIRLLEIIRASAEHSEGALCNAVSQAETRLSAFGAEATRLHSLIEDTEARSAALYGQIEQARQSGSTSVGHLREMEERIGTLSEESERLAVRAGTELREALDLLANSSETALKELRSNQSEVLDEIARKIASQSREKVAEAIKADAASTIKELEAAISRASENGRDTAITLRNQLAKLNELTGNLEQRIAYARERAGEKIGSDFSRRMALITEALNSSSIDISKAFDNEVSDTQWAHYLKGDRGIFTRRAVRLLDKPETRAVVEIYNEDGEFRETVNRFIHDFEAMLREVLSTRDGNALAVTLLSSDHGKLYVALAQAIDRLRD